VGQAQKVEGQKKPGEVEKARAGEGYILQRRREEGGEHTPTSVQARRAHRLERVVRRVGGGVMGEGEMLMLTFGVWIFGVACGMVIERDL